MPKQKKPDIFEQIDTLKAQLDQQRPLGATAAKRLQEYYRVGLTYASNALEGNTLDLMETKVVIEEGLTIGGKPLRDHLEAIGHAAAFDRLLEMAKRKTITEPDVLELHETFYRTLDPLTAGTYRTVQVYISGSEFVPPAPRRVPRLMKELFRNAKLQRKLLHPVAYAAWLHLEFVTIHPFVDGNGRTARLLMNLALVQTGYPVAIIPPVRRLDYLYALEREHTERVAGFENSFTALIAEMALTSLQDYHRMLQAGQ